jgi:hypothetical protein
MNIVHHDYAQGHHALSHHTTVPYLSKACLRCLVVAAPSRNGDFGVIPRWCIACKTKVGTDLVARVRLSQLAWSENCVDHLACLSIPCSGKVMFVGQFLTPAMNTIALYPDSDGPRQSSPSSSSSP